MKKNVIAVMLSLMMAVGSVGTVVPVFAAEEGTTAEAVVENGDGEEPEDVSGEVDSGEDTEDAGQSDSDIDGSEATDDGNAYIEDDIQSDDNVSDLADTGNSKQNDNVEEASEEFEDEIGPAGGTAEVQTKDLDQIQTFQNKVKIWKIGNQITIVFDSDEDIRLTYSIYSGRTDEILYTGDLKWDEESGLYFEAVDFDAVNEEMPAENDDSKEIHIKDTPVKIVLDDGSTRYEEIVSKDTGTAQIEEVETETGGQISIGWKTDKAADGYYVFVRRADEDSSVSVYNIIDEQINVDVSKDNISEISVAPYKYDENSGVKHFGEAAAYDAAEPAEAGATDHEDGEDGDESAYVGHGEEDGMTEEIVEDTEGLEAKAGPAESGTCGDNLTWTLDASGTLTISGTGKMADNSSYGGPWTKESVKKIIIENGVTRIGNYAFRYCENLTSISIPSSLTSIGMYAFDNCISLPEVSIPSSVTIIGSGAFLGCSSFTSATIPSGVTKIQDHTFAGCSNLTSVTIPSDVTIIDDYAFSKCSSLQNIIIPPHVREINNYAFYKCSSLKTVIIPSEVAYIGWAAFKYCDSLISVTIPSSVRSIDGDAFLECPQLKDIYYGGSESTWKKITDGFNPIQSETTVHYNCVTGNTLELDPEFTCFVGEQIIISATYKGENTVRSATIEPDLSDALELSGISIEGPVNHDDSIETYITFTATAKKAGEYKLILTTDDGISASTVIKVGAFNIEKADVKLNGTHLNDNNEECMYYTGKQIKPGVSEVTIGGTLLTEGEDYIVSYGNNIEFGEGKVIIEGIGNCVGKKSVVFNIVPEKLAYILEFDNKDGYRNINAIFDKKPEGINSVTILCYSSKERREYNEIAWGDIAVTNESGQYILKIAKLKHGGSFTVRITPGYKGITGDAVKRTISVPKALLPTDFWGFRNPDNQIMSKMYFKKYMGPAIAKELTYVGAVCYGMCLTGMNCVKNSSPDISSWQEARLLSEVNKKSIKSSDYNMEAIEYIKYAQAIMWLPDITNEENKNSGKLDALYSNLIRASKEGSALFIDLQFINDSGEYEDGKGHSILALDVAEETDTTVKILCYDPNYINNDRFMYLYRKNKNSSFDSWKYDAGILLGTYSGKAGERFISIYSSYSTGADNDLISYTTGDADYFKKVWERMSGYSSFEDFVLVCVRNHNEEINEEEEEYLSRLPYTDYYYSYLTKKGAIDKSENDGYYFWSQKQEFEFEGIPAGLTTTLAKNDHSVLISSSEKINAQMSVSDSKDSQVTIEPSSDGEANIVLYDAAQESNYSENTELTVSMSKGYKSAIQQREDHIYITGAERVSITKVTGEEDEDGVIAEGSSLTISSDLQLDKHYLFEHDDATVRIVGDLNDDGEYETVISESEVETSGPKIHSGTCGKNVTWKLDEEGVLTISGTGDMKDYDSESPFSSYDVKKVIIEKGVTGIGDRAFTDCSSITSVTIPETVTEIGNDAFKGCSNLTSITLPKSITELDVRVFGKNNNSIVVLTENTYVLDYCKSNGYKYYYRTAPVISKLASYNGSDIRVYIEKRDNASGYQIKYADNSSMTGAKTVMIKDNKTLSKVITGFKNNKTYYVQLQTYQKIGDKTYWSRWSAAKSIKITQTPYPTNVSKLSTYIGSHIKVDWTKTAGASGYHIKYADNSKMTGAKEVMVKGNSTFTKTLTGLKNGKTYYIKIQTYRTVSGKTYWSSWSPAKSIKVDQKPYGSSIKNLTIQSSGKVKVTWDKAPSASGYHIQYYWYDKNDKRVTKDIIINGNSTLSKTITGLKENKNYYVKIQTFRKISGKTYWSSWSKEAQFRFYTYYH